MNLKNRSLQGITLLLMLLTSGLTFAQGRYYSLDNHAVTNWLVVINYPEACAGVPCTEEDIFGALPDNPTKATVCYLTGQIARPGGKAVFAGRLGEGTSHGCFFPMSANPLGLKDAMRAEIHVIVQTHSSPRRGGEGREQQLTIAGAECNPTCADIQFAIHVATDAIDGTSTAPVLRFADGSTVTNAQSTLFRDPDGVRVVTDTLIEQPMDPMP